MVIAVSIIFSSQITYLVKIVLSFWVSARAFFNYNLPANKEFGSIVA
jgi:hypothetical protein